MRKHYLISGGKHPAPTGDLAAGDMVKVALNPDDWKAMQSGHGEWNDLMAEVSICMYKTCVCERCSVNGRLAQMVESSLSV